MDQSKVKFHIVLNTIFFIFNMLVLVYGSGISIITLLCLFIHVSLLLFWSGKLEGKSED